jgi:zinc/manganese transport system permease protein
MTAGSDIQGVAAWLDYAFLRRSLAATVILSTSMAPLGCLLILRRMSLVGDAMAHALLPGAAVAFLLAGLSLWPMAIGGAVAAILVSVLAAVLARVTPQREDSGFAALYVIALALGVVLLSLRSSPVDIDLLLFGSVLAVDAAGLMLVTAVASITFLVLALIYRPLVVDTLDSGFLEGRVSRSGIGVVFTALIAINLVAAFQVMGTLLGVGLLILPASAARFWFARLPQQCALAMLFGALSAVGGLMASFRSDLPSGPAIVLAAGAIYVLSLVFGSVGGILGAHRGRYAAGLE